MPINLQVNRRTWIFSYSKVTIVPHTPIVITCHNHDPANKLVDAQSNAHKGKCDIWFSNLLRAQINAELLDCVMGIATQATNDN